MLSNKAIYECTVLSDEAERLAKGSASDRLQAQILQQRIKTIQITGVTTEEGRAGYATELHHRLSGADDFEVRYRKAFINYMIKGEMNELRQVLVGAPVGSINYTAEAQGGALVPVDFVQETIEGMSQYTDLLNPNIIDLKLSPGPKLRPGQIAGFDLSTIAATYVQEDAQLTGSSFPAVSGGMLKPNLLFKIQFIASLEAEQDVDSFYSKTARAAGIAFGRAIGTNIIASSIFTGALAQSITSPVHTTGTGVIVLSDILAIYFGLNRIYRNSPKCAWVCNDSVYQRLRAAVDSNGRPLLSVKKDSEELMGKPIYISPDLPNLATANSTLYFGDLSHLIVRMNTPMFQRVTQNLSTFDILSGNVGYTFRSNVDCLVFDPTSGNTPPIISALVTK